MKYNNTKYILSTRWEAIARSIAFQKLLKHFNYLWKNVGYESHIRPSKESLSHLQINREIDYS